MTASSVAHNVGKHPTAKEERKVFYTGYYSIDDQNTARNFKGAHLSHPQLRKPLIERKRRERINNCLDQLKETVIGAFRLDVSIFSHASLLRACGKKIQELG